jgi:hypothetical protein
MMPFSRQLVLNRAKVKAHRLFIKAVDSKYGESQGVPYIVKAH